MDLRTLNLMAQNADMDAVLASSFADYHVKGFDYICLHRTETFTVKLYFFTGEIGAMPEVVNPHDHRYDFTTVCLRGGVINHAFFEMEEPTPTSTRYNRYRFKTPLAGGDGFTEDGTTDFISHPKRYYPGESYHSWAKDVHTISVNRDSALLLLQHRDRHGLDEGTAFYTLDDQPPALDGLYNRMTPDRVNHRLRSIGLCGIN